MDKKYPKIYFIWAGWERLYMLNYNIPPLGILRIAGATPECYQMEFTDEMVSPVDRNADADIVAISFLTPAAYNAYALGDYFRGQGKYVVFGGTHTTIMADQAAEHADTVIVGEGEQLWTKFLADYQAGSPAPRYAHTEFPELSGLPPLRRELLKPNIYPFENPMELGVESMELSRGCAARCAYCVVPYTQGPDFRNIPLDDIVAGYEEIAMSPGMIFFTDNYLMGNWKQTRLALEALIPFEKDWFGLISPEEVVTNSDKLDLLVRSGLVGVYGNVKAITGDESPEKLKTRISRIRQLTNHGVAVLATFAFGWDDHDGDVFKRTLDFCHESELVIPEFIINTPFPGSRQFKEYLAAGRITSTEWPRYNGSYAIYTPLQMSGDALESGTQWINETFYAGIDRDQAFSDSFKDRAFESMIRAKKKKYAKKYGK